MVPVWLAVKPWPTSVTRPQKKYWPVAPGAVQLNVAEVAPDTGFEALGEMPWYHW